MYAIECKENGNWIAYRYVITLEQWLDLLTAITDGHAATNDQMKELWLCLKEQGFLI